MRRYDETDAFMDGAEGAVQRAKALPDADLTDAEAAVRRARKLADEWARLPAPWPYVGGLLREALSCPECHRETGHKLDCSRRRRP